MFREPRAMREIHKIRREMYREFKGLSIDEIVQRIDEGAKEELIRINKLIEDQDQNEICVG